MPHIATLHLPIILPKFRPLRRIDLGAWPSGPVRAALAHRMAMATLAAAQPNTRFPLCCARRVDASTETIRINPAPHHPRDSSPATPHPRGAAPAPPA